MAQNNHRSAVVVNENGHGRYQQTVHSGRHTLTGDLSPQQRSRMLEIANKCPVHRTLCSDLQIVSFLAGSTELQAARNKDLTGNLC